MKEINHLDLFSGIGGFSKAIEELGIKTEYLGFSDIDKYANEVFQRRFAHGTKLGDIVSIKSEELPNIDLVTGGFPDNWTEGNSNTQRYKQCGNAVSVPVVKEIMRQVYEIANV